MIPPPDSHSTQARVCVVGASNAEWAGQRGRADVQAAAATRLGAAVTLFNENPDSPSDAAKAVLASADVALLNSELSEATLTRIADMSKGLGVTVTLHASEGRKLSRDLLCLVDLLIVNEQHAPALLGEPALAFDETPASHDELRALFQQLGVRTVVATLGPRGAWFLHDRSSRFVPAYSVTPIDPSGAGDAFVGVFSARWAEHLVGGLIDEPAVHDIACWACAAGALATTKHGVIDALPCRSEVIAKLRAIRA